MNPEPGLGVSLKPRSSLLLVRAAGESAGYHVRQDKLDGPLMLHWMAQELVVLPLPE